MPIHTAATVLSSIDPTIFGLTVLGVAATGYLKQRVSGRKCTWERDWAGKMILIVAPPTPTILSLIDYLLNLPRPPQILYLPPVSSPLSPDLLTILHAIRISTSSNPLAQLHCEPLPRTPIGVRSFMERWGKVSTGMTGEGGRRIDAMVLGAGWGVGEPDYLSTTQPGLRNVKDEKEWTVHEYHFHLIHSLLPALLRQPPERNIRIISLVSPTISAALPTLLGKPAKNDAAQVTGAKGITTLLFNKHLQLVLDTLSAAQLKKVVSVPSAEGDESRIKKREEGVSSNISVIGVIMPWTRDEVVRGVVRADDTWIRWLLWMILYPLLIIFTPSPRRAIHSILFALQAPVRYGPFDPSRQTSISIDPSAASSQQETNAAERADPRRSGVGNGDVVRDCAVAELAPILSDPKLAKITYDSLEKAVEDGVKADAKREKAFGSSPAHST